MANTGACLEFDKARKKFKDSLFVSLSKKEVGILFQFVESYNDERIERRTVLDQVFRDVLCQMVSEAKENDDLKWIVNFAVDSVKIDVCSPSTPFMMLADIFDMLTLERCEDIFDLVEDKVAIWKSDPFYESGKNYLLRMCNDLIRRLSKSQNTVFCGRIQLFLSRLFPLSEKSALNLASQFNLDNVTIYSNQKSSNESGDLSEPMEEDKDEKSSTIPIDYHLYQKFWALQDYFRRPVQCYEKGPWETFSQHAKDVMDIFSSYKLDDVSSSRKKTINPSTCQSSPTAQSTHQQMQNFFAKYLTSEKLLDLQLSDSNFRRYVLVQFLIIFQYLRIPVKFKNQSQALSEEQSDWIKESQETVYRLLSETPPHGEQFCNSVKHILEREEHWNSWKNESCPSFIKEKQKDQKPKAKPKRRRIGDDLMMTGGKVTKMGSPELTRLWNLNPDNMEACKAESRVFLPKLDDFFTNAIEQADPEAMVEEQYKDINQQNFQWKAYRLLARSSPHFFVHTNTPGQPLANHLKDIVDKMAKEKHPNMATVDVKQEMTVAEEEDEMKDNNDDEDELAQEEQEDNSPALQLTKDQVRIVSAQLGSNWMKLGIQLGVPKDDMDYFKGQFENNTEAAVSMITVWQEEDPDRDCVTVIKEALKAIQLDAIIDIIS